MIPPEKTRKFLRAAALGMVRGGMSYRDACDEFAAMLVRAACREHGNRNQAAKALKLSHTYVYKILPVKLQAKPKETPANPEQP